VTSNWSAGGIARTHAPRSAVIRGIAADEVIAAKERVMRALMAVGTEISGVLVDICCELKGIEQAEKGDGWPACAGKVVLQIALTRLARHYGLIGDGMQAPARRGLRIGAAPTTGRRSMGGRIMTRPDSNRARG